MASVMTLASLSSKFFITFPFDVVNTKLCRSEESTLMSPSALALVLHHGIFNTDF